MLYSTILDCSTPSKTGYDFTGTTATTYLGISNAACATGYDGTASPAQVQCKASGNWTVITGCNILLTYFDEFIFFYTCILFICNKISISNEFNLWSVHEFIDSVVLLHS